MTGVRVRVGVVALQHCLNERFVQALLFLHVLVRNRGPVVLLTDFHDITNLDEYTTYSCTHS